MPSLAEYGQSKFRKELNLVVQNYALANLAFCTMKNFAKVGPNLQGSNSALCGWILLKIYTLIPKLWYFQILLNISSELYSFEDHSNNALISGTGKMWMDGKNFLCHTIYTFQCYLFSTEVYSCLAGWYWNCMKLSLKHKLARWLFTKLFTREWEWLNLTAFLGTADSEVHMSRVFIAYTLESLSSLT